MFDFLLYASFFLQLLLDIDYSTKYKNEEKFGQKRSIAECTQVVIWCYGRMSSVRIGTSIPTNVGKNVYVEIVNDNLFTTQLINFNV